MALVLVQYRVRADRAAENRADVEAVFAALERERPAGVRYATFVRDDGVTFLHLASLEADDGSNPLLGVEAFRAFVARIRDRCEVPPSTTSLSRVGAYRLLCD